MHQQHAWKFSSDAPAISGLGLRRLPQDATVQSLARRSAYPEPESIFDDLIHAIGTEDFGRHLFKLLSATALIDHCTVITVAPDDRPRCVVNHGRETETFVRLMRAYESEYFRLDPRISAIMASRGTGELVHFGYNVGRAYPPLLKLVLLDPAEISDLHGFAFWHENLAYIVDVYCTGRRALSNASKHCIDRLGARIAAPIGRHFSLAPRIPHRGSNLIESVLRQSAVFKHTTRQEKAVCEGILRGHTSESIGLHLHISRNTVLTYRKRLYDKLKICSQHELFMLIINAAQDIEGTNAPDKGELRAYPADEWVDGFA